MKNTNEELQQKLTESERYGRQADITIEDLEAKLKAAESNDTDARCHVAELERKVEQLAAELSAVDAIHNDAVFITDDHYEQCPPEVQKIIRSLAVLQIPAYQQFLAEVRASGVEMFGKWLRDSADIFDKNSRHDWADQNRVHADKAAEFAAQLRQEAAK